MGLQGLCCYDSHQIILSHKSGFQEMSVCRRGFPILFKFTKRFYFRFILESQAGYFYNFINVLIVIFNDSISVCSTLFCEVHNALYSVFHKHLNVCSFILASLRC